MDFVTVDGQIADIEVRENTDLWGPFELDFSFGIPSDQSLLSVDVKAYLGKANEKTDLSQLAEITDLLVESAGLTIDGSKLAFLLQHPGEEYRGTRATLVFLITTTSRGVFPFFFFPVRIR